MYYGVPPVLRNFMYDPPPPVVYRFMDFTIDYWVLREKIMDAEKNLSFIKSRISELKTHKIRMKDTLELTLAFLSSSMGKNVSPETPDPQIEKIKLKIKEIKLKIKETEEKLRLEEWRAEERQNEINEFKQEQQNYVDQLADDIKPRLFDIEKRIEKSEKSPQLRKKEEENKRFEERERKEKKDQQPEKKTEIDKEFYAAHARLNRPPGTEKVSDKELYAAHARLSAAYAEARLKKSSELASSSQSSTVASRSQPESAQLPTVAPKSSPQGEESAEVPKPGVSLPSEPSLSSAASAGQPVKLEPKKAEKAAKEATIRPFPFEAGMSGMAMQRPTPPQKSVSIKKFFNEGFPATFFKADQRLQEGQEERERLAAEKAKKNKLKYEAEKLGLKPEEINQIIENFPEMLQGIINTEKKRQRAALASEEADKKNKKNLRKKVIL